MRKKMYVICFFALATFFTTIYYASYSYSLKNYTSENIITNNYVENPKATEDSKEVRAVNSSNELIVLKDAACVLQEYNLTSDSITEKEYKVPLELVGMSRDEVLTYMSNYMNDMPQEEQDLTKYELISFSSEKLVIRKSFKTEDDLSYTFWIQVVAGKVTVYKADKKTIYIQTDIKAEDLPEEEQEVLKEGKYITSMQELFNYLESCTT